MNISQSRESLVFDIRSLRLIIGALALAFPAVVYTLTGRITTSISASYHEPQTRDVFVGFLFILGALLVAYKGHRQWVPLAEGGSLWVWVRRHQEDCISAVGGIAAICAALFPTACDECTLDTKARIHTIGGFLLFFNVAYFSLIAFLRSLNKKLKAYDELRGIQSIAAGENRNLFLRLIHPLISETLLFRSIVAEVSRRYDEEYRGQNRNPSFSYRKDKIAYLLSAYGEKIARGFVYIICGSLTTLVLVIFVPMGLFLPGLVAASKMTFLVEAISLWLFGIAWMTASHIPFARKIRLLLAFRRQKRALVAEPGGAQLVEQ